MRQAQQSVTPRAVTSARHDVGIALLPPSIWEPGNTPKARPSSAAGRSQAAGDSWRCGPASQPGCLVGGRVSLIGGKLFSQRFTLHRAKLGTRVRGSTTSCTLYFMSRDIV